MPNVARSMPRVKEFIDRLDGAEFITILDLAPIGRCWDMPIIAKKGRKEEGKERKKNPCPHFDHTHCSAKGRWKSGERKEGGKRGEGGGEMKEEIGSHYET